MSDDFLVEMAELNRLEVDLGTVGARVTKEVITVVAKTAYAIEATGKVFCPVDTGNLRNGISTTISPTGLSAEIGPVAEYAPYVEFGTSRMGPHAFMGPAADINNPVFYAAIDAASDPKL